MAGRAVVTELRRYVVWVRRLRKLRRVTLIAILIVQVVVVIHMTRYARRGDVSTRQREPCAAMIERCRPPCGLRVTSLALPWEAARSVIRVCCVIEICLMAPNACCRQALILIVDVASVACRCLMRANEREARSTVIECCGSPCRLRMARLALRWVIACNVVRVRGCVEGGTMTRYAIKRLSAKHIVAVTTSALLRLVRSDERKARLGVVVATALPCSCAVTWLAISRESRSSMIRVCR